MHTHVHTHTHVAHTHDLHAACCESGAACISTEQQYYNGRPHFESAQQTHPVEVAVANIAEPYQQKLPSPPAEIHMRICTKMNIYTYTHKYT